MGPCRPTPWRIAERMYYMGNWAEDDIEALIQTRGISIVPKSATAEGANRVELTPAWQCRTGGFTAK